MSATPPGSAGEAAAGNGRRALLFGDLFFKLREAGIKVSLSEWMGLMQALYEKAIGPDLTDFYYVSRALLVKSEALFDVWDQVFTHVFGSGDMPTALAEELLSWLEDPKPFPQLSEEELAAIDALPLEELRELFEQRLREQKERHDGGNRWIGTGGTSPFGHGGQNPAGVRVGGRGGGRSAIQIASARAFKAYRNDRVLDTRSIGVALRKLKRLSREDGKPELDVDASIDATCKNAGELDLVFRPPRRNQARVMLLMDVGGSMDPYVQLVEKLFSAASHLNHWKKFEAFSFHNCVYERLYGTEFGSDDVPTNDVLKDRPKKTFVIFVGDASMAPSELTSRFGAVDYYHRNDTPGIVWLHRFRTRYPRSVWINPMPRDWWNGWTTRLISQIFPMFPLTIQGIEDAVDALRKKKPTPVPDLDPRILD